MLRRGGCAGLVACALLVAIPGVDASAAEAGAPAPDRGTGTASTLGYDRWYVQTSVLTTHFHSDPAHNDQQRLVDVSWRFRPEWLVGAAVFHNSFGQPSQYVYGGWMTHPVAAVPPLYLKITAGAVHGYKDPYRDKIPYNSKGVAPGIIPSIGYCYRAVCSELVVFGAAGVTLTFGVKIP
ncbi:MAG: hypothetical protein ABJC33_03245 [Betaproteobacteria bacterium]